MIRFFSGNNPLNVFILFFLGILIKLPYFLTPVIPQASTTDGFLYLQLLNWLKPAGNGFPTLYPIITYLFLFTQAVTFNGLINDLKLFSSPQYLIGFAYLFITSIVPGWNVLSPGLIINSIMVWALPHMIGLYHNQKPKGQLFNIGFGFGLCSFIYFPSVYLMVLLIIALALFRPLRISEWLVTIVGVLTPFYFLMVYFFVWDQMGQVSKIIPHHNLVLPDVVFNWQFWLSFSLIIAPVVIGLLLSMRYTVRMVVQVRKSWSLMIYYLVVACFLPFINNNGGLNQFVIAAVPMSIFCAAFYWFPRKKLIPELTIWAGFTWIVINYFSA